MAKLHRRPLPPATMVLAAASIAAATGAAKETPEYTATTRKASKPSKKRKLPASSVEDSTKPTKTGRVTASAATTAAAAVAAAAAAAAAPLLLTVAKPQQQQPTYSSATFKPAKRRMTVQELITKTAAALEAKYAHECHGRRLVLTAQERRMHETAEDKSVPCIHTVGMWTWLQDAGYMNHRGGIDAAEIRQLLQQEEETDGAAVLMSSHYQTQLLLVAQRTIGEDSNDASAHQKMSTMLTTGGGAAAVTTQSLLNQAKQHVDKGGGPEPNNKITFLDRLQSLLVHEGNDIDNDTDMTSDGDDDDDDSYVLVGRPRRHEEDDDDDDMISISSDEDNDDDDEYYDDNDNILTVNLSTLSMDERAFLHARRAGLMMDYDASTRAGLESLFGGGPSALMSPATAESTSATTTQQPAIRPSQPTNEINRMAATLASPKDQTFSKPTPSSNTINKADDDDKSKKSTATSSPSVKNAGQSTITAAAGGAKSDEKKDQSATSSVETTTKGQQPLSPATPSKDNNSQSTAPPAATTNTDMGEDGGKSDKSISKVSDGAGTGKRDRPVSTSGGSEPAADVDTDTTVAVLSVNIVNNANDPNGDGGDMPRTMKKKKRNCHLDDIIDSMTDDLLQVTELNHRRGVFLQRATLSCIERPDEFMQRKEREAQTIAACQALLKRTKEAAAARAKIQAKAGGSSSGGGGGNGVSDDLALPW